MIEPIGFVAHCREMLPEQFPMAVEFPQRPMVAEDTREKTLSFLRENKMIYIAVDEPQRASGRRGYI